jgi:hypothetical protein
MNWLKALTTRILRVASGSKQPINQQTVILRVQLNVPALFTYTRRDRPGIYGTINIVRANEIQLHQSAYHFGMLAFVRSHLSPLGQPVSYRMFVVYGVS